MRIGFVGVGMMGLPMVENLASRPGMDVVAFEGSPQRIAAIDSLRADSGAVASWRWAASLADLADRELVVTMLPNSAATNAVIAGTPTGGLADLLRPGTTIVDMGSSDPMQTRSLAACAQAAGLSLIDAPVSGSVAKARTGTLTIMVGGSDEAFECARPALQAMGSTLVRTGAVGSAHAMKALNNYVYAAGLLAVSEALTIARGMALDLEVFTEVLNTSSGRNVATETKLRQFLLTREFAGGFGLRLQAKDLATARALQQALDLDAPQLALCADLWQQAAAELDPAADNTEILRFVESRSLST